MDGSPSAAATSRTVAVHCHQSSGRTTSASATFRRRQSATASTGPASVVPSRTTLPPSGVSSENASRPSSR